MKNYKMKFALSLSKVFINEIMRRFNWLNKVVNKDYYKLLYLGVLLIGVVSCLSVPEDYEEKQHWLDDNIAPIESIEYPGTSNFESLKHSIGDAEIVMLGEQMHGAGATLAAKVNIVKMLHKEMGFEVIAFEAGLYDCYQAWKGISAGEDPYMAFEKGLFTIWAKSKQMTPLIAYITEQSNSKNPLVIEGFDFQNSGKIDLKERKAHLIRTLNWDSIYFKKQYPRLHFVFSEKGRMMELKKDSIAQQQTYSELNSLLHHFDTISITTDDEKIWKQTLHYTKSLLKFGWEIDFKDLEKTPQIANLRDKVMAENLIWLKEQMYPNKKIIVWGANSHLMYNRELIVDRPDKMIPMGDYIKKKYGDKIYCLAFTSHEGLVGTLEENRNYPINQSSTQSLEFLLNNNEYEFAFIDKGNAKSSKWLSGNFTMKAMGGMNWNGNWFEMCDGIFFSNEMTPNILTEYPDLDKR